VVGSTTHLRGAQSDLISKVRESIALGLWDTCVQPNDVSRVNPMCVLGLLQLNASTTLKQ
jgi:hypothetical protein